MSIKAKLEALIYAAEEPIGLDQMAALLKHDLLALKNQPVQPNEEDPENHLGAVEAARNDVAENVTLENVAVENEGIENAPAAGQQNVEQNALPDDQQSVQAP